MASNPQPMNGLPFSSAELRKFANKGPFFHFMDRQLSRADKAFKFDDFDSSTLDGNVWSGTTGANGTIAAIVVAGGTTLSGLAHGVMQMAGTTGGFSAFFGPNLYYGTQNAEIEVRFRQLGTTANAVMFELGFVDASGTTSAVNDIDTPSSNITTHALFAVDPSQTLTSAAFVTVGAASTTSITGQSIKATTLPFIAGMFPTSSGTVASTDCRINPGTFCTVRVSLRGSSAYCFVNGQLAAQHNTPDSSATAGNRGGFVAAGRSLAPWIFARNVVAGVSTIQVDYVALWQDRYGGQ